MNSSVLLLAREVESRDRAVIATDAAGTIIYWGDGARLLFGWAEAEVLGRHILEVTPTHFSKEDAEQVMQSLQAGDPWSGDILLQSRAGERFVAQVTDIPVHDKAGDLIGIVGITRRRVQVPPLSP